VALHDILREDRRLVVLRCLAEAMEYRLNESVLQTAIGRITHRCSRDELRADIGYLERHGLVLVQKLPLQSGELWLATLTPAGHDVARGQPHEGIARPGPAG
jgi:hypothetical protein